MKKFNLTVFFCFLLLYCNAQQLNFDWVRTIGNTTNNNSQSVLLVDALSVAPNNTVYSAGVFSGTVDFNVNHSSSQSITSVSITAFAGDGDIWLQKLDSTGSLAWAKRLHANNPPNITQYFVSITDIHGEDNNLYTTGTFSGTVDFDPGTNITNLTQPLTSAFIQKLDVNGDLVWVKAIPSVGMRQIITDNQGNVFLAGYINDTVDVDPGPGTTIISPGGIADLLILKLNSNGDLLWSKHLPNIGTTNSVTNSHDIALDAMGNITIVGDFVGTVDFDPGVGVASLSSNFTIANDRDGFVVQLDSNGDFVWVNHLTGIENIRATALAVNPINNHVYVAGDFEGTVDLDPSTATASYTSAGQTDVFVQRYNAVGQLFWSASIGGTGMEDIKDIEVDNVGKVYAIGNFYNVVDFDPSTGNAPMISSGDKDAFLWGLDAIGNFEWAQQIGGTTRDEANGLVKGTSNRWYANGEFSGSVDMDPSMGIFTVNALGVANRDAYVIAFNTPTTTSTTTLPTLSYRVYPSPSAGLLQLELGQTGTTQVTITDTYGRLVHPMLMITETTTQLDLSHLPVGTYYISIQQQGQTSLRRWLKY